MALRAKNLQPGALSAVVVGAMARMSSVLVCVLLAAGCGGDPEPDTDGTATDAATDGVGTSSGSNASSPQSGSSETQTSASEGSSGETTSDAGSGTTTGEQPQTSTTADAETGVDPTTSAGPTGTGGEESGTTEVPTSGPGVLPGESGQEAMCRRAIECGSTYYPDADACIDAGSNYWGTCASRQTALDNFGACMSDIPCDEYNPDAYNPASTPCADLWGDLQQSDAC